MLIGSKTTKNGEQIQKVMLRSKTVIKDFCKLKFFFCFDDYSKSFLKTYVQWIFCFSDEVVKL
jgi:hypothetical protein